MPRSICLTLWSMLQPHRQLWSLGLLKPTILQLLKLPQKLFCSQQRDLDEMWWKPPVLLLPSIGGNLYYYWRRSAKNKIRLWVLCDPVNKTRHILMTFYIILCCSGPLKQLSKAHPWQMNSNQPQMGQVVAIFKLQRISADFCSIFRSSKRSASTKDRCFSRFSFFFFNWEIWSLYKWDEITKNSDYLI